MQKRFIILISMLVLAVFAVGCVSAADDVATDIDESADDIEDVSADKVVENTRGSHIVTNSTSVSDINSEIESASNDDTNHVVDFTFGTYYNAQYNVKNNTVLDGHGSTLIGDGTHDIFLVTNCENFTIKNFIINVNNDTKGHGIYGHHVYNSIITNNTIYGCSDAINIYQIHENLTITDNTIYDFTGDGISLVNFYDYSNDTAGFASFVGSTVSGNNITGGEFGMFFGGNFKGTISNNNITNCTYGMEFKGKKAETNGILNANLTGNCILGSTIGINMDNPHVDYLNVSGGYIYGSSYAVFGGPNFAKTGHIYFTSPYYAYINYKFYSAID